MKQLELIDMACIKSLGRTMNPSVQAPRYTKTERKEAYTRELAKLRKLLGGTA